MIIPYLLLILGYALIFAEFYLPGAIMGILGSLFVLTSIYLFVSNTSSMLAALIFLIGAVFGSILVVKLALKSIVKTKSSFSIYLRGDQEGYQASSFDKSLIGREALVLTDLKPGGYVEVDGQKHQAISTSGYIPKGDNVTIIGGQEESLIVQSIQKEYLS